jgi:hypothetical protein
MNRRSARTRSRVRFRTPAKGIRRPFVPPPARSVVFQQRRNNAIVNDFVNQCIGVLRTSCNNPVFVLSMTFSLMVVLSGGDSIDAGPFAKLFPATSQNVFVTWIRENYQKFLGAMILLPVLVDAPEEHRSLTMLVGACWIFFVPEASFIEYTIQGLLAHLFFHLKNPTNRIIIIAIGLIAYAGGFLLVKKSVSTLPKTALPKTGK